MSEVRIMLLLRTKTGFEGAIERRERPAKAAFFVRNM